MTALLFPPLSLLPDLRKDMLRPHRPQDGRVGAGFGARQGACAEDVAKGPQQALHGGEGAWACMG